MSHNIRQSTNQSSARIGLLSNEHESHDALKPTTLLGNSVRDTLYSCQNDLSEALPLPKWIGWRQLDAHSVKRSSYQNCRNEQA